MKILFEDYHYDREVIPALEGIAPIELKDGKVKLPYVGYYYADEEVIFILPKVFILKDKNLDRFQAFGRYAPEEIIDTSAEQTLLSPEDKAFLFEVSTWLYQAIALFNARHTNNEISSSRSLAGLVGNRGEGEATLIDHILALLRFNKEHQTLFTYIAIIQNSGNNKIHWTKTIRQTQPLLHKGKPFYLNCKTKSKIINYDEELIVLFFSTLDYLARSYHFQVKKNLNYDTIKHHRVANLIETGKGTRLLRKIRNKYFTDELVALWGLLYAFYEQAERVEQKKAYSERLLVRNFNIVFEDMIDALIGEDELSSFKKQKDGKIVDHLYKDKSLLEQKNIYFIADSKYYKEDSDLEGVSLYKQFTYAKNIIQYNINLFNENPNEKGLLPYRDSLTEGYNPTPNFFVRGFIDPDDLTYQDNKLKLDFKKDDNDDRYIVDERFINLHFQNRLFDRDTLLLLPYSINFLFVLSAYVQSRATSDSVGRFLREVFRNNVIKVFDDTYDFYCITPKYNGLSQVECNKKFVDTHFRKLIGKIYCTTDGILLLALKKEESDNEQLLETILQDVQKEKITLTSLQNRTTD